MHCFLVLSDISKQVLILFNQDFFTVIKLHSNFYIKISPMYSVDSKEVQGIWKAQKIPQNQKTRSTTIIFLLSSSILKVIRNVAKIRISYVRGDKIFYIF